MLLSFIHFCFCREQTR